MRHMWVEEAMLLQLCVYLKGMSAQGRCHSLVMDYILFIKMFDNIFSVIHIGAHFYMFF